MKALIIDDEKLLAENLSDLLELDEVFSSIDICTDPKQIENATSHAYDFYFIDKNFAHIDGISFVKNHSEKFSHNSIIIFMSGENIDTEVATLNRPCEVIPKPISISEVIAKIKSLRQKAS